MARSVMAAAVVLCGLAVVFPLVADEQHHHDTSGRLGTVRFDISCKAAVREQFNRGVAQLHSFWYAEAEKSFAAVAQADPGCGMAYWGIAMSNYHPIWAPPTPEELKRGSEASRKAVELGARSPREKDYIAAIESFYRDFDRVDHRTRALAFEKAMETVHRKYPGDSEGAIFYSLALLGTAPMADKEYANQKRAAVILNRLLPKHPNHPGITHYVIHSFDYPKLAELALPAARSYAKIAPDSPHALHMPSHIFVRLGLWEDSIRSNIASAESAKRHVQKTKPGAGAFDQLHAMDYLAYAYLQRGNDEKAKQVLDEMRTISTLDLENFAAAYAFAAIPARYTLERQKWADAASLTLHPAGFPWRNFRFAEANLVFARGIGSARSGDTTTAKREVETLAAIEREVAKAPGYDWATQVGVQRRAVAAWIALAESRSDEALRLMREAADVEDSTDKHPVTPGPVLPARELLADMLQQLGRPAEALVEFKAVLRESPNRLNALRGAARAAQLAGRVDEARGERSRAGRTQ
jgi:tetratricopeptide (TPR) repeat protein